MASTQQIKFDDPLLFYHDATLVSDSPDVEFKVYDDGDITAEDDSDDSGITTKKQRSRRGASGRRIRRKSTDIVTKDSKAKEKKHRYYKQRISKFKNVKFKSHIPIYSPLN